MARRPPNVLLLLTDQQRYPRHWPDDPGWLRSLTPNDFELARTGVTFRRGFCNTSMCTPSRATLFTGQYPAQHGLPLTLTAADLRPDLRNTPAVSRALFEILRTPGAPRARAARQFVRGALRLPPRAGDEPNLRPEQQSLAHVLRSAGYEVAYKGKWHLTHPLDPDGWSDRDAKRLESEFGFASWEPPDAGENARAENFGGGSAGPGGKGWDEEYARQAERWLTRPDLPEPFCLVVSLVNPHDVLGYPSSYEAGGYSVADFRDLGVPLPPTVDDDLTDKPTVHTLIRMGMIAYLGPLHGRRAMEDYANFYAYLQGVVDQKIGRVLRALGDPDDPRSLRSRTVIVRCSDHGEMAMSHGGLRQKAFNAYEESIHVPLVVSNPVLFPRAAESDALASLVDVLPTLVSLSGASGDGLDLRGRDLTPVLAHHAEPRRLALRRTGVDLSQVAKHPRPAPSVQGWIHFTYDDHQAGTALGEVAGQPNRVRCVRDERTKYAVYLDPAEATDPPRAAAPEYELYDLERDPDESVNLVDRSTGEPRLPQDRGLRDEGEERLRVAMSELGTGLDGLAGPRPIPVET